MICKKDLMIVCHKVKAHTDDILNNEVDLLAKKGLIKNPFIYNIDCISKDKYIFNWSHVNIDGNVHQFVKDLNRAKSFEKVLISNRNEKTKYLTQTDQVDWNLTWTLLNHYGNDKLSLTEQSNIKTFKVKCFTQELPVLAKLKI